MAAQVPTAYYLVLAAILFSIGAGSFLIKRNIITIFMSIELMLNAVNLTFVAFAHQWHQISGQIFGVFVMVQRQLTGIRRRVERVAGFERVEREAATAVPMATGKTNGKGETPAPETIVASAG